MVLPVNTCLSVSSVPNIALDSMDSKMNEVGVQSVHSIPAPLDVGTRRLHEVMCQLKVYSGASSVSGLLVCPPCSYILGTHSQCEVWIWSWMANT